MQLVQPQLRLIHQRSSRTPARLVVGALGQACWSVQHLLHLRHGEQAELEVAQLGVEGRASANLPVM